MNATVTWNNNIRPVKNLGWLRRHAWEVRFIRAEKFVRPNERGNVARLVAVLLSGKKFECEFASWSVLLAWIDRPSLSHCQVETIVPSLLQPARLLGDLEVVQRGHLVLWSTKPRDAWATVDAGS